MKKSIPKLAEEYFESYRLLFLRTRKEATNFRYVSDLLEKTTKLTYPFFLPIIPAIIWILSTDAGIKISSWPINIENFYFLSWCINLILLASLFLLLLYVPFYFYYEKRKYEIIRRIQYPLCLLKEANSEIKSYLVNNDVLRLSKAIEYIHDYTVLERKNDLIVMRPLGGGDISIGISRKAYSALTIILEEESWIQITPTTKAIAESLDFVYTKSIYFLQNFLEEKTDISGLEEFIKALDFLAIHEFLKLQKNEELRDKLNDLTYLKKFASSVSKISFNLSSIDKEEVKPETFTSSLLSVWMTKIDWSYLNVIKYFVITALILFGFYWIGINALGLKIQTVSIGQIFIPSMAVAVAFGMRNYAKRRVVQTNTREIVDEEE